MPLCGYLSAAGAALVVSDLDANRCARAAATYGATVAAPEEIHAQHVDVFAPAAMVRIHLPPAVRWYGAGGEGGGTIVAASN
jgi:hypothetical protein